MTSIRRTLLAWILGGLAIVLLVAGVVVYLMARSGMRSQLDQSLTARARTFAALVVDDPGGLEIEEDADGELTIDDEVGGLELDYLGSLDETQLGIWLRITADDGSIVAVSPAWPAACAAAVPPAPSDVEIDDHTDETFEDSDALSGSATDQMRPRTVLLDDGSSGRLVRLVGSAQLDDQDEDGDSESVSEDGGDPDDIDSLEHSERGIAVEVIGRTESADAAAATVIVALSAGGLLALIGIGGVVWFGVGLGLHPVRRLGDALDDVGAAKMSIPAPATAHPRELEPIVTALRRLLDRLQAAMDRERRFTDAAAHELRTPLAELRTLTDVADRWPEPERLHHTIIEARAVVDEMETLLEVLLATARGGAAYESQPVVDVALLPLAESIAERHQGHLGPRRVSCEIAGDRHARWTAPRGAVLAILRNLINNAAEYTGEGGAIRIGARCTNGSTALEIENGPVAIDAENVERLFEPFWRADRARTDRLHRGLGLAIVDALCQPLDIRRTATIDGDRLRIRLTWAADSR